MRCIKHLLFFTVLLSAELSWANLSSSVNRTELALGETLQLIIVFEGNTQGQTPDLSALTNSFKVLNAYPSTMRQSINGVSSLKTQWTLELEPLKKGKLLIPPMSLAGFNSDAISIEVHDEHSAPAHLDNLMIETIVDKSTAYVQEQIKLSYRLYYRVSVDDVAVEELQLNDAVLKKLESKRYQRKIDGQQYQVVEFNYALLPQRSGSLVIPALNWQVDVLQGRTRALFGGFSRSQPYKLRSDEKVLRVKSIPDEFPKDAPWVVANNLILSERWSKDPGALRAGEPMTREVTIQAEGIEAAQLPAVLHEQSSDKFKIYIDSPKLEDGENARGLLAKRTDSAAIVLSSATASLAAIRVPWWNAQSDQLEWAQLKSTELRLAPGQQAPATSPVSGAPEYSNSATSAATPTANSAHSSSTAPSPSWWLVSSLALNILMLGALIYLFFSQRNRRDDALSPTEKNSATSNTRPEQSKQLKFWAEKNDSENFYNELLKFSSSNFSCSPAELANRSEATDELKTQLAYLNAALFSKNATDNNNQTALDLNVLYQALLRYKQATKKQQTSNLQALW
ncbi:BatD family protein [Agaribacterium haliotis]|uniref:BatD family protein n=1 Tax=Agaribacterium haliotis TaxID=2013869 RepID=UPI0013043AA1|nr:BatD family protein [Agaribacterium haliotis]